MSGFIASSSERFAKFCGRELEIEDPNRIEELRYGTYHTISAIIKLSIVYVIALILGIFTEVLVSNVAFSLLRYFAGGIHARTHKGCTFVGNFVMTYLPAGIAILLKNVAISNMLYNNVYAIVLLVGLILIVVYAPADLANKPIHSIKRRKILRLGAIITLAIYYLISMIYPGYTSNVIMSATLLEVLSITPLAYKAFNNKYGAGYGVDNIKEVDGSA